MSDILYILFVHLLINSYIQDHLSMNQTPINQLCWDDSPHHKPVRKEVILHRKQWNEIKQLYDINKKSIKKKYYILYYTI